MRGQQAAGVMLSMVVRSYHTNIKSPTLILTNEITKQMRWIFVMLSMVVWSYHTNTGYHCIVKYVT